MRFLNDLVPEAEMLDLLRRILRIDSSNPPGNEEPVALILADAFTAAGLSVTVDAFEPGRANVVARWPGTGQRPAFLFSGHLDTVPAAGAGWNHPPHAATFTDGTLHGRGTVDMKGAVAAMAAACIGLARGGIRLAGDVIFAGTAGEEVDSAGAKRLASQGIGSIGEIVVGEPTNLRVASAHKGALWLELETIGKAAHGSMPEQGSNAIVAMIDALSALRGFRSGIPPHPLLGAPTLNIGTIRGGTKTNIVPDRCLVTLDLRTLPGEAHPPIVRQLEQLMPGVGIRVVNSMPAVETPVSAPLIQSALALSPGAPPRGMTYYSDASVLVPALQAPALIYGPGDERLCHQVNENVAAAAIAAAAGFYFNLVQERLR